ncbi:MAG: methionine--tRNA ligase, partial [Myxococcota bacterium]|nr:methionine--tRNA ligase [Myxococcota bacterium]
MTHRYFTTPIYYVNDRPHIGHAYTTILADSLARWSKLAGHDTFFLTGTDEHGRKVQLAAEKRGVSPQVHVDEMHRSFKELWPTLYVENNRFIRTTEPGHREVVQAALQQLYDAGLIYAKEYGGWYSVSEERFWTEKDLVDGKCPLSGNSVEWIEEKNYFFKMSNYQEPLLKHIEENPDFIRPNHRKNEVLGFLRQPLEDLCISRPKNRLSWGIEIPFDTDYVTYVWFDALLNYLTGIGYHPDPEHAEQDWQQWWSESLHLLGKDILTTHCVYWTTMLLALDIPLPKGLVAHGWWLIDGSKMSKSKGNVVNPMSLKDTYGVEVFRYYLARDMSVGSDANFSEFGLVTRNNSELA